VSAFVDKIGDIYETQRSSGEYEIDGLILTDNSKAYPPNASGNPAHSIAFKMDLEDQQAETEVLQVLWERSRYNVFKPVVSIKRVHLCGVDIDKATGYNAAYIEENKIGPGARVVVIRSGDVIPKIIKITKPAPDGPQFPEEGYEWNGTHVDIVATEKTKIVFIKLIEKFFVSIKADGVRESTIEKMYSDGLTSITDICRASPSRFFEIDGFQEKIAKKLHTNIHEALKSVTFPQLMAGAECFPQGIGARKMKMVFKKYPDLIIREDPKDPMSPFIVNPKYEESLGAHIMSVVSFAEKTTEMVTSNIGTFMEFLNQLPRKDLIYLAVPKTEEDRGGAGEAGDNPFEGKTFVFSGYRPKDTMSMIEEQGGRITGSVSSKTDFVITPDTESTAGKVAKARSLGIPVLSPEDFTARFINGDADESSDSDSKSGSGEVSDEGSSSSDSDFVRVPKGGGEVDYLIHFCNCTSKGGATSPVTHHLFKAYPNANVYANRTREPESPELLGSISVHDSSKWPFGIVNAYVFWYSGAPRDTGLDTKKNRKKYLSAALKKIAKEFGDKVFFGIYSVDANKKLIAQIEKQGLKYKIIELEN
jgi:hypothetical protein